MFKVHCSIELINLLLLVINFLEMNEDFNLILCLTLSIRMNINVSKKT